MEHVWNLFYVAEPKSVIVQQEKLTEHEIAPPPPNLEIRWSRAAPLAVSRLATGPKLSSEDEEEVTRRSYSSDAPSRSSTRERAELKESERAMGASCPQGAQLQKERPPSERSCKRRGRDVGESASG